MKTKIETGDVQHKVQMPSRNSGKAVKLIVFALAAVISNTLFAQVLHVPYGKVGTSCSISSVGIGTWCPTATLEVAGTAKVQKLRLGDKWLLSGVGDVYGNDDWLRLFNATGGTDYYGGFAAEKLWTRLLYLGGYSPTIRFADRDNYSGFIHQNSDWMYFLSSAGANASTWTIHGSHWPLRINMSNDNIEVGGNMSVMEGNVEVKQALSVGGLSQDFNQNKFVVKNDAGDQVFMVKRNVSSPDYASVVMGIGGATSPSVKIFGGLCVVPLKGDACPDYVFEEDYQLKSLEDLENFVKTNKHLPNVPNANEIKEKGGVDMIKLNYALLEKVEELTLYTIEQDKQIKQLKTDEDKQIEQLKAEQEKQTDQFELLKKELEALKTQK